MRFLSFHIPSRPCFCSCFQDSFEISENMHICPPIYHKFLPLRFCWFTLEMSPCIQHPHPADRKSPRFKLDITVYTYIHLLHMPIAVYILLYLPIIDRGPHNVSITTHFPANPRNCSSIKYMHALRQNKPH